jgi:hypothetical protein
LTASKLSRCFPAAPILNNSPTVLARLPDRLHLCHFETVLAAASHLLDAAARALVE